MFSFLYSVKEKLLCLITCFKCYIQGKYISAMNLGGALTWSIETDDFRGLCHGKTFVLTKAIVNSMNSPAALPNNPCATTTGTTVPGPITTAAAGQTSTSASATTTTKTPTTTLVVAQTTTTATAKPINTTSSTGAAAQTTTTASPGQCSCPLTTTAPVCFLLQSCCLDIALFIC